MLMSDKLKEALIKVRLKIAFAPLPLAGGRRRARLRQRKNQITRVVFFGYRLAAVRPSPNPSQREGNLLNQSFL